ncbi:hypothetical protein V6N12_029667 [Hibiscus sabdariffa]|uniref:Uncharacterized protein n=1 Tax=Hibiscus sabdariffa TaxID=183260 RepID=A0ABR2CWS8_9ROSI
MHRPNGVSVHSDCCIGLRKPEREHGDASFKEIVLSKNTKRFVQRLIFEIQKLCEKHANGILEGGSVVQVSGITVVHAVGEVWFEITNIDKANVLEPIVTDPQLYCNKKQTLFQWSLGLFRLLYWPQKA